MFDLNHLPPVRAVPWEKLQPGMILAGGVTINGAVPPELRDYPVLDHALLNELHGRYQFLRGRRLLVLDGSDRDLSAAREASRQLQTELERLRHLQAFRDRFRDERRDLLTSLGLPPDQVLLKSDLVEQTSLIPDRWNSFTVAVPLTLPSLLGDLERTMTAADLLSGALIKAFRLPQVKPLLLHLVLDYSYSMQVTGRDRFVQAAVSYFRTLTEKMLSDVTLRLYGFSETCLPLANLDPRGSELPRRGTSYTSFLHKVLHYRDPDRTNLVLLFSDGLPQDSAEAQRNAERLRRLNMDFCQVVFLLPEDQRCVLEGDGSTAALDGWAVPQLVGKTEAQQSRQRSDEELQAALEQQRADYTAFAAAAGGSQVILTVNQAAGLVGIETFDRYLGLRSAAASTTLKTGSMP